MEKLLEVKILLVRLHHVLYSEVEMVLEVVKGAAWY